MNKTLVALGLFSLIAFCPKANAQRLSPLAPPPKWAELEAFQETITHDEFVGLLDQVYAPRDAAKGFIEVLPEEARIKTQLVPAATWTLRFAHDAASPKPPPRFWRPAASLPPAPAGQPLAGVKIAIDPGHLGGDWAHMEERFLQIGDSPPITEGDMTLRVAQLLQPKLEALGAKVTLVRKSPGPVTSDRPETLRDPARAELQRQGVTNPHETYHDRNEDGLNETVQYESELLFYRTSEIRRRAEIVDTQIQPDFTLCLHFNADPWGDPKHPDLSTANHMHVLLNGCYSTAELRNDDVRFDMLVKLLNRSFPEELGLSTQVAESLSHANGLPPYTYTTPNAVNIDHNPYLWARNLLANRLYRTPVVFIEPYVMNSENIRDRVAAGDYEGEREVAGASRRSLYREYADGVAEGLRAYFEKNRTTSGR